MLTAIQYTLNINHRVIRVQLATANTPMHTSI